MWSTSTQTKQTMKELRLTIAALLACLLLAVPDQAFALGGTNSCNESGTSLAAGATSPQCLVTLPTSRVLKKGRILKIRL